MTSILDLTTEGINKHMQVNFEPNFCECGHAVKTSHSYVRD